MQMSTAPTNEHTPSKGWVKFEDEETASEKSASTNPEDDAGSKSEVILILRLFLQQF
jgi:hypothetical protein